MDFIPTESDLCELVNSDGINTVQQIGNEQSGSMKHEATSKIFKKKCKGEEGVGKSEDMIAKVNNLYVSSTTILYITQPAELQIKKQCG